MSLSTFVGQPIVFTPMSGSGEKSIVEKFLELGTEWGPGLDQSEGLVPSTIAAVTPFP